jgi:protein disulfide-isomerase-like protein
MSLSPALLPALALALGLALLSVSSLSVSQSSIQALVFDNDQVFHLLSHASSNHSHTPALIKFYAPWCTHCKKLEPVFDELAQYVGSDGHMQVIKVNAVQNKACAKEFNVTKYPTITYVKNGHVGVYHGARKIESLKAFADRVRSPPFSFVYGDGDLLSAVHANNVENVSFVLQLPCNSLESTCAEQFRKTIDSFVHVSSKMSMEAAFVLHFQPTAATQLCKYDISLSGLTPLCITDPAVLGNAFSVTGFIVDHNYPLIAHFENHNFHRLAQMNSTMIAAIVDYSQPYIHSIQQSFEDIAFKYEIRNPDLKIIMGMLEGKRWRNFCKLHHAGTPSFLILDHGEERHAVFPITSNKIEDISLLLDEIVKSILEGTIVLTQTDTNPSLFTKIVSRFTRYLPWSLALFISPIILIIVSIFFPKPSKKKQA